MKRVIVATHNGYFHADDVFALVVLLKAFREVTLIRSRNPEELAKADIVFDVGGGAYDHHKVDKEVREDGVPYAAFGLIWRAFGIQVLTKEGIVEAEALKKVHASIEEKLVMGIDALDNGHTVEKDPLINVYNISSIIASFNPKFGEDTDADTQFEKAVEFADVIFDNIIRSEKAKLLSEEVIIEAFAKRTTKEVLELPAPCNWKEKLIELDVNEEVLYVIFPDENEGYRIQVVPKQIDSFEARKPLPNTWAGKRNEELNEIVGISDSIFCHPARFIAGAFSKESIDKMVKLAIEENV